MRRAGLWGHVALLVAVAVPAAAASAGPSAIIPNKTIGPFGLGMTPAQIEVARRTAPCGVRATFEQGRAVRLETNCGGAYHTEELLQVGSDPGRVLAIFGTPERVTKSDFRETRADWLHYSRHGIAFRAIYGLYGYGFIQAIAVFPGTAPGAPRRPVPAPAPTPAGPEVPPAVGE